MIDSHRETYREEARELLGELETALLELEKVPADGELIGRVFRAMHTIKGSGAMFGFDDIAAFTHDVETVYDLVRSGRIPVTKPLIDLTLAAGDEIRAMVDAAAGGGSGKNARAELLSRSFKEILQGHQEPAPPRAAPPSSAAAAAALPGGGGPTATYRIRFRPAADLFVSGTNPLLLLNELRELGACTVVAHREGIPNLAAMDPEACYTYWDIILTTSRDSNAIRDVFIFVEDACELKIAVIDSGEPSAADHDPPKLGEILVDRGDLSGAEIRQVLDSRPRIGELLVASGRVTPDRVASALAEQQHLREVQQRRSGAEATASIRVPAEKLDTMVNLVGELVTIQSRLSQLAAGGDLALQQVAEEVERLTAELRENTMSVRMLPIGTTFSKFQRLVRDLAAEMGKEIVLQTEGGETELDKTVIERLNDPLIHLIRNCIDHGIEPPEVRQQAGKPRQGTVHLSASHSGAHVLIRIRDDGAGLAAGRIREKALEKGLIAPEALLAEQDLFGLIFLPGFSTNENVTSISGRGVGMDVVKRSIEGLQGTIAMASQSGMGTTITLKLPLTLAIIDGLLVKIAALHFVIPLSAVDECVELTRQQVADAHGRNLVPIRGELVPYIRLRERFGIRGTPPAIEQIITTRFDGSRVGLVVDQVIGEHQTVIKPLGRVYRGVEEISGATILGDGSVALIIDIAKLVHAAGKEASTTPGGGTNRR
jgi:two-component system chemotaxis sensor kinase CheA